MSTVYSFPVVLQSLGPKHSMAWHSTAQLVTAHSTAQPITAHSTAQHSKAQHSTALGLFLTMDVWSSTLRGTTSFIHGIIITPDI